MHTTQDFLYLKHYNYTIIYPFYRDIQRSTKAFPLAATYTLAIVSRQYA